MMTRRGLLAGGIATASTLAAPAAHAGLFSPNIVRRNEFAIECAHKGTRCILKKDHSVTRSEVLKFSNMARDWRADVAKKMDPKLVLFLKKLTDYAGHDEQFFLISGYRTPETNKALNGTVKNSYHTKARAIDLRHSQMNIDRMFEIAHAGRFGGVGYYEPRRGNFVHMDTGNFRTW